MPNRYCKGKREEAQGVVLHLKSAPRCAHSVIPRTRLFFLEQASGGNDEALQVRCGQLEPPAAAGCCAMIFGGVAASFAAAIDDAVHHRRGLIWSGGGGTRSRAASQ